MSEKLGFGRPRRQEREKIAEGIVDHNEDKLEKPFERPFTELLQLNSQIEDGFYEEGRDFRSSGDFYALAHEREKLERKLSQHLDSLIELGNYEEVVEAARDALEAIDVKGAESITTKTPAAAVLIADAVNRAAKTYDRGFYVLKPDVVVAAWKMGAQFGIGKDRGGEVVYYLGDPVIGVTSFHDPGGDIAAIIKNSLHEEIPIWPDKWSQVRRDVEAYDILEAYTKDDEEFLENMSESTSTEEDFKIRKQYLSDRRSKFPSAMSEYLGTMLEKLNARKG